MIYYLDTNICIYALKGTYANIQHHFNNCVPECIKIPSIVKAELLYGAEKSNKPEKTRNAVIKFLYPFEVVPFDSISAESYAGIRVSLEKKGTVIGPNDLIIAATVLANNAVLITHNCNEFSRVDNLKIKDWTKDNMQIG